MLSSSNVFYQWSGKFFVSVAGVKTTFVFFFRSCLETFNWLELELSEREVAFRGKVSVQGSFLYHNFSCKMVSTKFLKTLVHVLLWTYVSGMIPISRIFAEIGIHPTHDFAVAGFVRILLAIVRSQMCSQFHLFIQTQDLTTHVTQ